MIRYRIYVKGGAPVAGYNSVNMQRKQVMPGVYAAYWTSYEHGESRRAIAHLRLIGADQAGGDLDVKLEEYLAELEQWPNLPPHSHFEILDWSVDLS